MTAYEQVRAKLPLLDYLNRYLSMGISASSLPRNVSCPLHRDNKPSFRLYVPVDRGGYCFSCGKAYDAISMHQHLNNLTYAQAMVQLAKDLNIPIVFGDSRGDSVAQGRLTELVKENLALIKNEPDFPLNFDTLARKVYRAVRSGNLNELIIDDNDEF